MNPAMQSLEHSRRSRSRPDISRVWRILYVLYSLEVGSFLLILPWLAMWDNNYLIYKYPDVRPIVTNSFLKGAVLGLGILNILIGVQEIVKFLKSLKRQVPG
jgi:hypothetical protein